MANFRIKVEALNPDVKVQEAMLNGIECDGYFLCADDKDQRTVSIDNLNTIDIAIGIAKSTELLEAAMIAHGMEEARLMKKNRETPDLAVAFGKIFGKE